MIIVNLTGGLGNQMFQYAFGRYLAIKNKTQLKYHFTNALFNTKRQFELDIFGIKATPATDKDLKKIGVIKNPILNRVSYLLDERLGINFNKRIITDFPPYKYKPSYLKTKNNVYLQGYWSDERYFKKVADIICKDFSFKKKLDSKNKKILKIIKNTNSVSVHVRRGDYITNKTGPKFLGLNHYQKKISNLEKKIKKPVFFIFSDDIPWCKKNLTSEHKIYFIFGNKETNAWKDMFLMSRCKHNIIANSTFSWWANWLKINSNGK